MRVFSVGSWSNFGSMVISIALLGFGVAGTLLTIVSSRVRRNPDPWLVFSALALAPSMAVAHSVAQLVPFNPVPHHERPGTALVDRRVLRALRDPLPRRRDLHRHDVRHVLEPHAHPLLLEHAGLRTRRPPRARRDVPLPADFLIYPLVGIAVLPALLCCVHWDSAKERFDVAAVDAVLCLAIALVSFGIRPVRAVSVSDFKPAECRR